MKAIYRLAAFLLLLAPAVLAQEHYTEGPVWRVSLIRVKPTAMDAYLTSLQQASKPILEEQKRNGTIMDLQILSQGDQEQSRRLGRLPGSGIQEPRCYGWLSG